MKKMQTATALSLTLSFADRALGAGQTCGDITCMNNSTCIFEVPNFEDHRLPDGTVLDIHSTTSPSHCTCPPGWTGVSCDVRYHSCDGSSHKCYHSGECVLGLIDTYDNEQLYCNCDTAKDEEGNQYVGKYCEEKAMMYCYDDKSRFCLNGGVCNDEFPISGKSCECSHGFVGEHCEYKRDEVPTCTLDCQNGGHCKLGTPREPPMDYFNVSGKAAERFQYCECSEEFHGEFCEISSEECGDGVCFHGAKCVESTVNGETLHHCDCRYANTDAHSYAGRYCQYEATQFCDKDNGGINGHLFCVNDGTCQSDAYLGCVCPKGYRGFSCEYYIGEDDPAKPHASPLDDMEDTICSLHCNGHGTCRDGIKEKPSDEAVGAAEHLNGDEVLTSQNYEHCVCEPGWTGLECEHQAKKCGGGEYYCFHGSECYSGGDEQKCDCSTANSTSLGTNQFAGDLCEHPATEICVEDVGVKLSKGLSFCVNYGKCKAKVKEGEPHPGCSCDETHWTGPHCEIKIAQQTPPRPAPAPAVKNVNEDGNAWQVTSTVIAVLAIIAMVAIAVNQFVGCHRNRKRRTDKNALHWESNRNLGAYRDEPVKEVNLSPRRESTIQRQVKNTPGQGATASSSRDPFAAHLVVPPAPAPPLNAAGVDDGPQVYLGPPQDEDGHVLHSVDII